jgi:hypothetical protein
MINDDEPQLSVNSIFGKYVQASLLDFHSYTFQQMTVFYNHFLDFCKGETDGITEEEAKLYIDAQVKLLSRTIV